MGCKIAIREGSAARNFDALESLIDEYPELCMFCSDDKHPDELLLGHINQLAARAVANGRDVMNVLRASSLNPVRHYGLNVGLLQIGDPADFVVVSNLRDFRVLETYIDGQKVAGGGKCFLHDAKPETINHFQAQPIDVPDLCVEPPPIPNPCQIRVIEALDGQLVTRSTIREGKVIDGNVVSDPDNDLLKLVVVNRYQPAKPAVAFISGFGISKGAIASTVAHDSHNIVATGDNDIDLCNAINAVIKTEGGLSVATGKRIDILPLPVAGLMAIDSCEVVGGKYSLLDQHAKQLGSKMRSPFMTLSFMALLVIPSLKLSDKGLFDVEIFDFVPLFASDAIPNQDARNY